MQPAKPSLHQVAMVSLTAAESLQVLTQTQRCCVNVLGHLRGTRASQPLTSEPSVLGPAVVSLGALGWPLMIGNLSFQLLAVWFALRPAAHRLLGAYLIVFHASSALMLTIDFSPQVMLAGILFVASPLAPRRQRPWDIARQAVHLAGRREVHGDERRVSSVE